MYRSGNGIHAYKQTRVATADPKGLVLMCYEGAISSLILAKEKYISREYEAKTKALQKVHDILNVLMLSLDFEKGGRIARNLDALYNYMSRRLLDGDLKKDMAAIDEAIGIFAELQSAWKEILSTPKTNDVQVSGRAGDAVVHKTEPARVIGAY
jgi:flagellar protein FliS